MTSRPLKEPLVNTMRPTVGYPSSKGVRASLNNQTNPDFTYGTANAYETTQGQVLGNKLGANVDASGGELVIAGLPFKPAMQTCWPF